MKRLSSLASSFKPIKGLCNSLSPLNESRAAFPIIFNRQLRNWTVPQSFDAVEYPERMRLKFVDRQPTYPAGLRPPKMQRALIYSRGPEEVHTKFVHEQFGVVSRGPGRMVYNHFEMLRLTLIRKLDSSRMFAVWRVDPPWQPVTKKGQGKRMGGGKGAIDHYCTPIKAGRVIFEVGGRCEYYEVKHILKTLAGLMPFKAEAMSHEEMIKREERLKEKENLNSNPYTFKYLIKNNMGGVHQWISPYDRKWFGEHV